MKSSDITLSISIILSFIALLLFNILSIGIQKIKDDWPKYRCNPAVMPFAGVFGEDTSQNFTHCIRTMQTDYMDELLKPIDFNLDLLGGITEQISGAMDKVRSFIAKLREDITSIIKKVFGVFMGIIIQFQRLILSLKDMMYKVLGVMVTSMNLLKSFELLGKATWDGPPGDIVRTLCFDPETKVRLHDGKLVAMKDIPLNSKLKTGSTVQSVMHISNIKENGQQRETMYTIKGGENNSDIVVSGNHLVYDPKRRMFVCVKDIDNPKYVRMITDRKQEALCCLITSDHTIPIGNWVFHDWEDNNGSTSKTLV